ncbi:PsiF family protein [Dankookia sp. GCM10030260]|uniref:PsiF family protein n=1 Tax=Dankookia sp. GCM10030260 TaxID=3273390 RepID=UPI003609CE99
MRRHALLALPILVALTAPAAAQPAPTAQQERMTSCNADAAAKTLAGDARKAFMSDCLAGRTTAAAPPPLTAQQDRMKSCNAEAATKSLSGEPRQRFMSACLSGSTAAGASGAAPAVADGSGRFASEASAKRACGGDPVVWANPGSQIFHAAGTQFYGKTADGGYMCRAAAEKAGYKLAGGKG